MLASKQKIALSLLALLIGGSGALGVLACSTIPESIGLQDDRLRPCPDSPNCVSSEDPASPAFVEPLRYSGSFEEAFDSLVERLSVEPQVELIEAEAGYIHAVFTSALMRFRDDVEFRFDAESSVVHVRSASRIGHSDLGANRARIEALRSSWGAAKVSENPPLQ